MRLILLFSLGRLIVGPAVAMTVWGPAKVIDAETLRVGGQLIRLSGVAAPKPGDKCAMRNATTPCGRGATAALIDLTAGAEVRCQTHGGANPKDIMLATCTASDYDLSEGMIYTGWAGPDKRDTPAIARSRKRPKNAGMYCGAESFQRLSTRRPLEQFLTNENCEAILSDWKNFSNSEGLSIFRIKML